MSFISFYFKILSYLACGKKIIRLASKNSVKLGAKSTSDFLSLMMVSAQVVKTSVNTNNIFNFQAKYVLIYMLLFYKISAWVFLIHMFLYAGFYCTQQTRTITQTTTTITMYTAIRTYRIYKFCKQVIIFYETLHLN